MLRFKTAVTKEPLRQLVLIFYNEHIITRQVRDAHCLIRMSVQLFPADIVHYFNSYVMNVWLSNTYAFVIVNAYINVSLYSKESLYVL
jgi:hypothetical protein